MRIGIIIAMEKEFNQLKTLLSSSVSEQHNGKDFVIGTIGDNEVIMQQSGMGKVNSTVGAVELINNYHPDLVISSGVAGGADTTLNIKDVVVADACCYHDAYYGKECEFGQVMGMPATFKCPEHLVEKALSLNCGVHVRKGLIVTGDWFVDTKDKMREILNHFPSAQAVDMESCSIAQTCHIYNTPFISFRIISDIPLNDTDASQYYDFWSQIAEGSFNVTKNFLESI